LRERALVSFIAACWARAARLTERWRDQAMRPRQRRTLMAMKPRMAPTTMKTVPSGRVLCCMKGACLVSGTTGVTTVAIPVKVGRFDGSEGRAPVSVPDVPPVMVGIGAVFVPVEPPVIEILEPVFVAALVFPVFVAAEVFPFVCVAVERFGRSVAAADCADVPIASSETARAVEKSDVFRKSLIMNVQSNHRAK
jgi:hypothetical protein